MAVLSLSTAALNHSSSSLLYFAAVSLLHSSAAPPRRFTWRIRVASSHSNPKILKSNRRSRHGQPLSPYDTDDDVDAAASDQLNDDWFPDDELGGVKISEADRQRLKLKRAAHKGQGRTRHIGRSRGFESSSPARNLETRLNKSVAKNGRYTLENIDGDDSHSVVSSNLNSKDKDAGSSAKNRYGHLSEELDLDERYFPLLNYLSTFGL